MALNKRVVSLPFTQGLETKIDEKQQPIGTLRVLENVVLDSPLELKKRTGYDEILLDQVDNTKITNVKEITAFQNELVLFSSTNIYSYIDSLQKWTSKGYSKTAIPESSIIKKDDVNKTKYDSIHLEGLNLYVYQDTNGIHLSITDSQTNTTVLKNSTITASGIKPRIISRENEVYILFVDGVNLKYRKFKVFDFNNIDAESTIVSDVHGSNKIYDAITVGDRITVAYNSSASTQSLALRQILSDDTLQTTINESPEQASVAINLQTDEASRIICSYYDGTDVKTIIYNYTTGVKIVSETSIETIANITNVASVESTTGNYTIIYESSAAATKDHFIKSNTIDLAASVGTASVLKRSVGIASKMFKHDNISYFTAIHSNTLQSTYFIIDISGNIISRFSENIGGDLIAADLPCASTISTNNFLIPSQVKGRLVGSNGTFFSLLGINSTALNFDQTNKHQNQTLGENLHIAGGFLKMYDNVNTVEHGFHLYPESISNGGTSTSGGSMSDGQYGYIAVYAWSDGKGQIHRSAASPSESITLSGGGSTQQQTVTIPTLRLTDKENVIIELYRTEASGTIYYKVSSISAPTLNDTTIDSVNIVDTTSDSDLIDNELLYTTGGELDNIAPEASDIITSHKNRIFLTSAKANIIQFSKIQFEGFPVEFNDTLRLKIAEVGGNNTAMVSMDDKLIIFKENAIYYVSGDGPNNIGEQDTFIEPELIISDLGCTNTNSVVLSPLGTFFKSKKGIYLLDRALSLSYIGSPVEEFNNLTITSANVVPDKNQIRFSTSDGDTLVFNYFLKKWSSFTNHKSKSAITLNNEYYYVRNDDILYKSNSSTFGDNGSTVKMKIETGWISFAGLQGFQRVYKMLLLGDYKSSHKLRIRVAYNFKDQWVEEKIIDTSDFITSTTYGSQSPYGTENTYGTDNNQYQLRLDFSRQKCESIKVSIEDLQSTVGEGLQLSNIAFVVGLKGSENKINQSQQYGSS